MVSISPLIAYKINDMISVGATLNVNYGMFSIKMHAGETELPVPPYVLDLGQYEESMNGWGLGATFGAPRQTVQDRKLRAHGPDPDRGEVQGRRPDLEPFSAGV